MVKYKKVVILIDSETQSTGEVMAATLKKYNVGVLVGTSTKGWGTIEQITKLDNQLSSEREYSMMLVQSITLRDDGQPIEGRGVSPLVDITQKNWEQELEKYYSYQPLLDAVEELVNK